MSRLVKRIPFVSNDRTPLIPKEGKAASKTTTSSSSASWDDKATIPDITSYSKLGDPPEEAKNIFRSIVDITFLGILSVFVLVLLLLLSPFLLLFSIIQRIHVAFLRYHTPTSKQRIAVIGGGWGGLQCMAQLHELGVHDVKGFERFDRWGGTFQPGLRYHTLQIHGAMWVTTFKDFPYSKDQDINDGKVSGEEATRYFDRFGKEKNLMDAYTFNAQVVEIKYSTGTTTSAEGGESTASPTVKREATLVVKDTVTGGTWTEGPFDLVIYASQASEPNIPDIPGRKDYEGEVYHSIQFKKEQYEDIVQNGKKVVVVGGSKSSCDLALCFHRSGHENYSWLYKTPYLFFKYEVLFHDRSFFNILRGFTTVIGLISSLISQNACGWIFWASGLAVTHDGNPPTHNNWKKFKFGMLCPKQRRDLSLIPKERFIQGKPEAYTQTGLRLSDGTTVDADVILLATGCESGIDKIRLTKNDSQYTLSPNTTMFNHYIVPDFPVLANATALWTTFGPLRGVNSADMAVHHLCIQRQLTEKEMERSSKLQLGGFNSVSGILFQNHTSFTKLLLLLHLDLMFRGYINVVDFLVHFVEIFCLSKQTALKIRLPKVEEK